MPCLFQSRGLEIYPFTHTRVYWRGKARLSLFFVNFFLVTFSLLAFFSRALHSNDLLRCMLCVQLVLFALLVLPVPPALKSLRTLETLETLLPLGRTASVCDSPTEERRQWLHLRFNRAVSSYAIHLPNATLTTLY